MGELIKSWSAAMVEDMNVGASMGAERCRNELRVVSKEQLSITVSGDNGNTHIC